MRSVLAHRCLFIGAHPDDIEIGCGGTAAKLSALGWEVTFLIMADEDGEHRQVRRQEAIAAAAELGVSSERVLFGGFRDRFISQDGDTVARIRALMNDGGVAPEVVFVHARRDQHNDHQATLHAALAAFRDVLMLGYYIPNSVTEGAFQPRLYVDISGYEERKEAALRCHASQDSAGRIHWSRLTELAERFAAGTGIRNCEAMELLVWPDAIDRQKLYFTINDAPFLKFWTGVARDQPIQIITAEGRSESARGVATDAFREAEGLEELRQAFSRHWTGTYPLSEASSGSEGIFDRLSETLIIVVGGPVTNRISNEYVQHLFGLRYVVDYTAPGFTDIRIFDRRRCVEIRSSYVQRKGRRPIIEKDFGILTVARNPQSGGTIVGCMGIHSLGTKGCLLAIASPDLIAEVYQIFSAGTGAAIRFGQLLLTVDGRDERVSLLPDSFHELD